jgi:CheY-like chemotaxis protein
MPGMPARILIVDDEPDLRAILGESLTGHGHEVVTAATGAAAITAVRNQRPTASAFRQGP